MRQTNSPTGTRHDSHRHYELGLDGSWGGRLPEALRLGLEAEEMYDEEKRSGALLNRGRRHKRKRAGERLKFTDPW